MNDFSQLCVWEGTVVGEADKEDFLKWIDSHFGVRAKYYCEVMTLPDKDEKGFTVPETGGRNDLFFHIHNEDVAKFAAPRLAYGIRWWEDVIGNGNGHLYTDEFIKSINQLK